LVVTIVVIVAIMVVAAPSVIPVAIAVGVHEDASPEEEPISAEIVVTGIPAPVEESTQFIALLVRLPAVRTIKPLGPVKVALLPFDAAAASAIESVRP
jgi:hypothetical protein